MDVSIVIINYNTFKLTCECIQSVIEKTQGLVYEIVLVDNGSTEVDPDEFLEKFPKIILIKSQTNLGFAVGCNRGINQAIGNYILLLNSDTILINNAVAVCFNFLLENPSVAVVSSRLEYLNGQVQHNCQRFPTVKYGLFELFRLQKILSRKVAGKILFGYFFDYESVAYPDWVWGTFFMFEKSRLQLLQNKNLADDFFMYGEDMQWCKDFKLLGYNIAFEPAAKVIHHVGSSGAQRVNLIQKNKAAFMRKYYSKVEIVLITWIEGLLSK